MNQFDHSSKNNRNNFYSICIVSHNRKDELESTLMSLYMLVGHNVELLVCLDGCTDESKSLIKLFPKIQWSSNRNSIGASPSRAAIYDKAKGNIIIGLDDDAHPLQADFLERVDKKFNNNRKVAVYTFEEIKGIFETDEQCLQQHQSISDFACNSFVGCGFAIRREAYNQTKGFPKWIRIYGEEACVSIELLEIGWEICYTSDIMVNHRVDRNYRNNSGRNLFRYKQQLLNSFMFIIVYYPIHLFPRKIVKLFYHNWKEYARKDKAYMKVFFGGILRSIFKLPSGFKNRSPISKKTITKFNNLPHPKYG